MTQDPHSLADLATQFPPLPAPIAKNHQRRQPQRIEPMRKSSIPPGDFSPSSFTGPFLSVEKSPKLGREDDADRDFL